MFLGEVMRAMDRLELDPDIVDLSDISNDRIKTLMENLLSFDSQKRYSMKIVCDEIRKIRGKFTSL